MASAALSLSAVMGTSRSRIRSSSLPAIFEESTDSPAAVARTAATMAAGGALFSR
jgi:hypothetical protein